MQQLAGQSVTNNYATYFCKSACLMALNAPCCCSLADLRLVQLAGNAAPFTVTIILAVCQLAGVLTSSVISDKFGRRWLTLGLFGAGTLAILAIGILGSFNYGSEELGSALVSPSHPYHNYHIKLL